MFYVILTKKKKISTASHKQDVTQGQFFKAKFKRFEFGFLSRKQVVISKLKKKKNPSSYYLPRAGGKIIGGIPFPKVLAQGEILTALFRI